MEDRILLESRKMVQQEINEALREQQANLNDSISVALRSGAVTPVAPMTPDPQRQKAEILSTLHKGQVNLAFQQVSCYLLKVQFCCLSIENIKCLALFKICWYILTFR